MQISQKKLKKYEKEYHTMREQQAQQEDPIERFEVCLLIAWKMQGAFCLSFHVILPITSFTEFSVKFTTTVSRLQLSLPVQLQTNCLIEFSGLSSQLISSRWTKPLESVKFFFVDLGNKKLFLWKHIRSSRISLSFP